MGKRSHIIKAFFWASVWPVSILLFKEPTLILSSLHRYIDDSFYTSNETAEKVQEILETANRLHPNIKLTWKISKAVSFLDLSISNNDGHLSSSVYHKPGSEPSVVPFLSDHPRHVFQNIVHTALMRAIRYSSSFELFDDEQRSIRLLLLYNG